MFRYFLLMVLLGFPFLAQANDDPFTPLSVPAINRFLQNLFAPVSASQPDWLTRLDVTFTKLDYDRSVIAFNGGVEVKTSGWSTKPSSFSFSLDFASPPNLYAADRNDTKLQVQAVVSTEILPLAHFAALRYSRAHCTGLRKESVQAASYRRAHCDFAARLAQTSHVADLADAFLESVADLTHQLSEVERGLLAPWQIVPTVETPDAFRLLATASGDPTTRGTLELKVTGERMEVNANLAIAQTDAAKNLPLSLLATYLGGFLEADPAQAARLQKDLVDYIKTLRSR